MKQNLVLAYDAEAKGARVGAKGYANNRNFLQINNENQVYQKDVKGHEGCVNSVTFNHNEDLIATGGDDTRVLVWHTGDMLLSDDPEPACVMNHHHHSNIFALEFAIGGNRLFSGGNDGMVFVHDIGTGALITNYNAAESRRWRFSTAVYGISASPIDANVFVSVSDSRNLTQHDLRDPKRVEHLPMGHKLISVMFNPSAPNLLVVAGTDLISVIDLRKSAANDIYKGRLTEFASHGSTHASWNRTGNGLGIMRNGDPPIYVNLDGKIIYKLEDPTNEYQNVHTIKSLDFMDDSIIAGSEDFRLYKWRIDEDGDVVECDVEKGFYVKSIPLTTRLSGHRSIPNQVQYSSKNRLLVSSGVEKIIKLWSPLAFPGGNIAHHGRLPGSFREANRRFRFIEPDDPLDEDATTLAHFDDLILGTDDADDVDRYFNGIEDDSDDDEVNAFLREISVSSDSSVEEEHVFGHRLAVPEESYSDMDTDSDNGDADAEDAEDVDAADSEDSDEDMDADEEKDGSGEEEA